MPHFFAPLIAELDRWAKNERVAAFWWRDDDAYEMTPLFERLLAVAGDHPLILAVVPAGLTAELVARLASSNRIAILQHGWTHHNHAPAEMPVLSEFPGHRSEHEVRNEILQGRAILARNFGGRALPVFVPPWGAIDRRFLPILVDCGFTWTSGTTEWLEPETGLRDIRVHADMIDWEGGVDRDGGRNMGDPRQKVAYLCDHLRARRLGWVSGREPTGILTHHMQQSRASYRLVAELLHVTDKHPAARWLDGVEVFARASTGLSRELTAQPSPVPSVSPSVLARPANTVKPGKKALVKSRRKGKPGAMSKKKVLTVRKPRQT